MAKRTCEYTRCPEPTRPGVKRMKGDEDGREHGWMHSECRKRARREARINAYVKAFANSFGVKPWEAAAISEPEEDETEW